MSLVLPSYRVDLQPPFLLFAHGLGSRNPQARSHLNDDWVQVAAEAAKAANASFLTYTARGHGRSTGWESSAVTDPLQFTWARLSEDMLSTADAQGLGAFVAGGNSMGSATALYCAMQHPDRVLGLVLVRLPTAWEERKARRKHLLRSAERLRNESPDSIYPRVLEGATLSDLPEESSEEYAKVKCPVLILAVENDDAHPLSTAHVIHRLVPHSKMHVSSTEEVAAEEFPPLIANFLLEIRSANTTGRQQII